MEIVSQRGAPLVFWETVTAAGTVLRPRLTAAPPWGVQDVDGAWCLTVEVYWVRNVASTRRRPAAASHLGLTQGLLAWPTPEDHEDTQGSPSVGFPALLVTRDGALVWQTAPDTSFASPSRLLAPNTWLCFFLCYSEAAGYSVAVRRCGEESTCTAVPFHSLVPMTIKNSMPWYQKDVLGTRSRHERPQQPWQPVPVARLHVGVAPASDPWTGLISHIHVDQGEAAYFSARAAFAAQTGRLSERLQSALGTLSSLNTPPPFPPSFPTSYFQSHDAKRAPLVSVDQLLHWEPPPWRAQVQPFKAARHMKSAPFTIVCHDMGGGYASDAFDTALAPVDNSPAYSFLHWSSTDVFIYFSHYRVTIPPLNWSHAAHTHGARSMGTLIFEWDDGADDTTHLLRNASRAVTQLCSLAQYFQFDGYLLNFESAVPEEDVGALRDFVQRLSLSIKASVGDHAIIIWYDSVSAISGKVVWQNEANHHNIPFLEAGADLLFLNYHWTRESLQSSVVALESAEIDVSRVCVGVDIWGRGTPFGGGFQSSRAVQEIKTIHSKYSVALFAPAWTIEAQAPTWEQRERWLQLVEPALWNISNASIVDTLDLASIATWTAEPDEDGWQPLALSQGRFLPSSRIGSDVPAVNTASAVVVASFRRCRRRARIRVPIEWRRQAAMAEVWVRGTPPNCRDPFRFSIKAHGEGTEIVLFDSGPDGFTPESGDWIMLTATFSTSNFEEIDWIEEGSDSERWRGNFGACFSNRSLTILTSNFDPNALSIPLAAARETPDILSLPFSTCFGTGVSRGGIFAEGRLVWSNVKKQPYYQSNYLQTPLPKLTFPGVNLTETLAFHGGSCVQLSLGEAKTYSLFSIAQETIQALDSVEIVLRPVVGAETAFFFSLSTDSVAEPLILRAAPGSISSGVPPAEIIAVNSGWIRYLWIVKAPDLLRATQPCSLNVHVADCFPDQQMLLGGVYLSPTNAVRASSCAFEVWVDLEAVSGSSWLSNSLTYDACVHWMYVCDTVVSHVDIYRATETSEAPSSFVARVPASLGHFVVAHVPPASRIRCILFSSTHTQMVIADGVVPSMPPPK